MQLHRQNIRLDRQILFEILAVSLNLEVGHIFFYFGLGQGLNSYVWLEKVTAGARNSKNNIPSYFIFELNWKIEGGKGVFSGWKSKYMH